MTVTTIRSRSADNRWFPVASRALSFSTSTRNRGREATVSVCGEVDATNAKQFARVVREAARSCTGIILDLTEVPFMAFDGVSALYAISAYLLREDVAWCVVASPAVTRVLSLCDPEGLIPLATGIPVLRSAAPA